MHWRIMKTVKEECEEALKNVAKKIQDSVKLERDDIQLLLLARLMEEESNERQTS